MKVLFFLSAKYTKKHLRQFVATVLCVSLFLGGFLAALLYQSSIDASIKNDRKLKYGLAYGLSLDVDEGRLNPQILTEWNAGLIYMDGVLEHFDMSKDLTPSVGYMDNKALELYCVEVQEGRMPQSGNEIAAEENTLKKLSLEASVGDTITIILSGNVKKEYVLTGILSNYVFFHKNGYDSDLIPGFLTSAPSDNYQAVHVIYGKNIGEFDRVEPFGGTIYGSENAYSSSDPVENYIRVRGAIVGFTLGVFFLLIMAFGIYNISLGSLQDKKLFFERLWRLGLSKKQGRLLFLIQSFWLSLCSVLIASVLGTAFLYITILFLNFLGNSFVFAVSFLPYLIIAFVCFAIVTYSYIRQYNQIANGKVLPSRVKLRRKKEEKSKNLNELLLRCVESSPFGSPKKQNRFSVVVIAGCMAILIFGTFFSQFGPKGYYEEEQERADIIKTDYQMIGAGYATSYFLLNFPRDAGVPAEGVERIKNSENFVLDFYYMGYNSPAKLLISEESSPKLREYASKKESFRSWDDGSNEAVSKSIEEAGYLPSEDIVDEPILGFPFYQFEKISDCLIAGEVKSADYAEGQSVAVFNSVFDVGDEITLTCIVYSSAFSPEGRPEVVNFKVKVAATYSTQNVLDSDMRYLTQNFSNGILISDSFLKSIDPSLQYDSVSFSYAGEPSQEFSQDVADEIQDIMLHTRNVGILEHSKIQLEWKKMINQIESPVRVSVVIFLAILFFAMSLTNTVKLKSALRKIGLLRVVGLDKKEVKKLIIKMNLKIALWSIVIGSVLGSFLSWLLYLTSTYIQATELVLQKVLPVSLIGAALILGVALLSCVRPLRWLLKKDIIPSLQIVQY